MIDAEALARTCVVVRKPSGLVVARHPELAGFLATHTDEAMLRRELPNMVRHWLDQPGRARA